ncbi:MAG: hypothetical protein KIT68_07665 [Phycisphaeraceae bacterium]|nr:hypothetical protein [Phycisphaeraceae bacterium]
MPRPARPSRPANGSKHRAGPHPSGGRARPAGAKGPKRPRPRPQTIDAGRDAVLAWLSRQAAKWPELELRPFESPAGLDGRDAALAHAIADAVVRRWLTLEFLINARASRPLEGMQPGLQAALLAGAAQIFLLDRVPAYAAIDHAVEYAKRHVRAGAGDLTNAVLRRLAELKGERSGEPWRGEPDRLPMDGGGSLSLRQAVLPDDALARLGVATSHPREILEAWSQRMDGQAVRDLAMHSLCAAPTVLNVAHADPSQPLPDDLLTPHGTPHCRVFRGGREALLALLAARPDVWVQDAASTLAVLSVANLRPAPRLIVDPCAGQGTKTRQLAAVFPEATIVATDVEPRRLGILRETFAGNDRVEVMPHTEIEARCAREADLVLLDVPCTNTGVLARRPEAKYRYAVRSLGDLARLQRKIFDQAVSLLRPMSGAILYSTCSIEPRENEQQVEWATTQRGMRAGRLEQTPPAGAPEDGPERYHDGAFSVLLTPG